MPSELLSISMPSSVNCLVVVQVLSKDVVNVGGVGSMKGIDLSIRNSSLRKVILLCIKVGLKHLWRGFPIFKHNYLQGM
jgi:hypothetical protein